MIVFQNISKTYPQEIGTKKKKAVDNVSFVVNQGQTMGLIGANGAGKSTSIRLIMDFIRPDEGTITLFDKSPRSTSLRKRIGYLPEVANFPANLTVLDLIRFTGITCNIPKPILKERSKQLLDLLNLSEVKNRPLRTYSKGMQQRANFVIALINDPELLILDEPMSGLDPLGRNQLITLIKQLKKEGKTILFCSHILGDVDLLVDELLVLHKGRCLFTGTPTVLLETEKRSSVEAAYLSLIHRAENAS